MDNKDLDTSMPVEQWVRRVPGWETAEITKRPLVGGLTNKSFYLEVNGEPYKLRLNGDNTTRLNINRDTELAALRTAAAAGYAPEVIHVFEPEKHLITRYIDGTLWTYSDMQTPDVMRRLLSTLYQIHRLPPIEGIFSPIRDIEFRLAQAREDERFTQETVATFVARGREITEQFWGKPASDIGLCHNDPFPGNFIATEERVYFFDWEFAGMGDIYYDLASMSMVVPPEGRADYLATYFGFVPENGVGKMTAMRFLMGLWNWSWAVLQSQSADVLEEHIQQERGIREWLLANL